MRNRICSIEYMNSLMKLNLLCDVDAPPSDNDMLQWDSASGLWLTTPNPTAPADGIFGHWSRDNATTTITTAVSGDDLTLTGNLTLPDGGTISALGGLGTDLITLNGTLGEVTIDGDVISTGRGYFTSPDSLAGAVNLSGMNPSLWQTVERFGGFFAFDMFNLMATNTTTTLTSQMGKIGIFGNLQTGINPPENRYMFFGANDTTEFNNAVFKIDSQDLIGIGIPSTDRPLSLLDVRGETRISGNVRIGDTTAPTYALEVAGVVKSESGRIVKTARLTANTTLDTTYHEVFCDTDGGAFTVTLPATPVDGQKYRITNSGNNNLTLGRNGNTIKGSATDAIVPSGDTLILTWEPTEGWW